MPANDIPLNLTREHCSACDGILKTKGRRAERAALLMIDPADADQRCAERGAFPASGL